MGAVRKVATYLGLGTVDQYDEAYDYDDVAEDEWVPAAERAARRWHTADEEEPARIVVVKPQAYGDAPVIGNHFRDGQAVIMDVTGMPMAEATRMVDFAAGLIYGCEGRIERITDRVFLLVPLDMELTME